MSELSESFSFQSLPMLGHGTELHLSVTVNYSIVVLSYLLALMSQCVDSVHCLYGGSNGCFTGPLKDATFCLCLGVSV